MKTKVRKNLKSFIKDFFSVLKRPEMTVLPGQLAFFFFLAIVPTITLISFSASWLNLSTDVIFEFLENAFSKDVANLLLTTSSSYTGLRFATLLIITYFIASNGSASIIITSNTIYGEKPDGFFKRRIKAIFMTLILVLLFLFLLVVPLFGTMITDFLNYVNVDNDISQNIVRIISILKGPISWFIIFFMITLIYTMAPNKNVKSKSVTYGAIFTSFSWIIITELFSYYINNIADYSTFYGSLATIVPLMLWIYFLSYIFTIGIALNYRKEEVELEKNGIINNKN